MIIDFNDVDIDLTDMDITDDDIEAYNRQKEAMVVAEQTEGIPLMRPVMKIASLPPVPAVSVRKHYELVENPGALFDFSTTTLSPIQQMYVMGYALKGTQLGACQHASVPYSVVEGWMRDETFLKAIESAVKVSQDSLEEELIRRAMNGSDKLLLEAVRAAKPSKYSAKTQSEVNVNGQVVHSWADLAIQASGIKQSYVEMEEIDEEDSGIDTAGADESNGNTN